MKLFKRLWTWVGCGVCDLGFWKVWKVLILFSLVGLFFCAIGKVLNFWPILFLSLVVAFMIIFSPQEIGKNYRIKIKEQKNRFEKILKKACFLNGTITEEDIRKSFNCTVKIAKLNLNGQLLTNWVSKFDELISYFEEIKLLSLHKDLAEGTISRITNPEQSTRHIIQDLNEKAMRLKKQLFG